MTPVYVVEKDEAGQPEVLYRFLCDRENTIAAYLASDGRWVEDWDLIFILGELHNPFYEKVGEDEAIQIAKEFFGIEISSLELIAA
jgi:hypothetical protein